ncbi:MAG: SagB family peptide dehydrogenase, partial [Acidobacteria bacterium]|nr:SagB family peptide dehydrogenase [Acidobacteriota bacterium]
MTNRNLDETWKYHNGTKHSFWSIRRNAHPLDWPNRPLPFKNYLTLDPIELQREVPQLEAPLLEAIAATEIEVDGEAVPDLKDLVQLLYYSAGITKSKQYPVGEIHFRAASCTGALYEIELYLVCGDLPDLKAGVYHFNPGDLSLRRLRAGDFRGVIAQATGQELAVMKAPVTIICTGTYWRNSWKYRARTYRHFGWDNGTILSNLLATAMALRLPAKIVMGFVDDEVNQLLSLDTQREAAFSLVTLGYSLSPLPVEPAEIEPLNLENMPLSPREVDYPAMREIHAASSLRTEEEVRTWRTQTPAKRHPEPMGELIPLKPLDDSAVVRDGVGPVILRRGSTRRFARDKALGFEQLSTLIHRSMQGIPADFLDPVGTHLNDLYLIVNAVEGLRMGAYVLHRDEGMLELLKEGDFRAKAGYLGLEQDLPAEASATIFFLADL